MRNFHCDHCGHPIFFENVRCLQCGSALAFLPRRLALCAVEPVPDREGVWRRRKQRAASQHTYRLCVNHDQHQACNFAVPEHDPNPLCVSCRQTRILPDLSVPENIDRWYKIEIAKRRLFYTLAKLGLVKPDPPDGERDGPVFEFLADTPGQHVMTGHAQGVITLNIAEADDAERVRRRVQMREPYRTLLGHLRHESGHFFWDRLIANTEHLAEFRAMFGDETRDYGQSLKSYYASGAAPDWESHHVSAYATSHPWEDWAETWAHYLHMVDLLETAASYNTRLALDDEEDVDEVMNPFEPGAGNFSDLVEDWVPLTLLVNSLNRSLGQDDAYPFALSSAALQKLRFVHDVIHGTRVNPAPAPSRAGSGRAEPTTAPS
jgi:hypothetical protein